jgi:hypothetical protein
MRHRVIRHGAPAGLSTLLGVGAGILTNILTARWSWTLASGFVTVAVGWITLEVWRATQETPSSEPGADTREGGPRLEAWAEQRSHIDGWRFHQERAPQLEVRVTTHTAVRRPNGAPLRLLELRALGPEDLDKVDVNVEDGRWLAFTAKQDNVKGEMFVGYAENDFSPEATLVSHQAEWPHTLRVGGAPANWRIQLRNLPLSTGDHAPTLRVTCWSGNESWTVATPVKDSHLLFEHPTYEYLVPENLRRPRNAQ